MFSCFSDKSQKMNSFVDDEKQILNINHEVEVLE